MGGREEGQGQFFYSFDLDKIVPPDHLVRQIDGFLDLSWVHKELAPYYSHTGRPSMIRMLIVGYVFALRSELLLPQSSEGLSAVPDSALNGFGRHVVELPLWRCVVRLPRPIRHAGRVAIESNSAMQTPQSQPMIRTNIPFRLDRLPWSRFHLLVVVGLGITWILDGLEVTIVGSLGPALQSTETLHLSSANLGAVASFYVVGAVVGALVFGWITDRHGRRLVFYVTLIVYLSGVLLSAFAWDFWSFAIFRMITGFGIGGEYAAVNSAIDELIPAKYRGRIDLVVNGSFWLGAAAGALAVPFLLDQRLFAPDIGWRLGFGIGAVL